MSLTVENLSSITLDVLSSVQYGWRSLEATVRIRLKTRGRKLKSKTMLNSSGESGHPWLVFDFRGKLSIFHI